MVNANSYMFTVSGWSERTKLYPNISKVSPSGKLPELRDVSERQ